MVERYAASRVGRRGFLGAVGGVGVLGLWPAEARAGVVCQDFMDGRRCASGIASELMHVPATANTQWQDKWCWAACVAMIFAYNGHPVSQTRIVQECFGAIVNLPAQPGEILAALNRPWIDDLGVPFSAVSGNGLSDPVHIAQDLAQDYPLIIGTHGHAMVMTAIEYGAPWIPTWQGPMLGPVAVLSATVRDPWPGQGRRLLRPDEWQQIFFVAHIRVT